MSSETTGFAASTISDDGKAALTEPRAGVVITASPIQFVDRTSIFRIWPESSLRILFQPLRKSLYQSKAIPHIITMAKLLGKYSFADKPNRIN